MLGGVHRERYTLFTPPGIVVVSIARLGHARILVNQLNAFSVDAHKKRSLFLGLAATAAASFYPKALQSFSLLLGNDQ